MQSIEFIDGIKANQEHPTTFHIPSVEEKQLLTVGDYVKVGFQSKYGNERMWLQIEEVAYPKFHGKLDNDPVVIKNIKCGDSFEVTANHILDFIKS